MKNLSKKNIDIVINKVLRETLEEKASEIKSKLKNELDEKMMDDAHPTFGHMTPEELRSFYKKMKKDGIYLKDKSHKPKPKDNDEEEYPDFGFGDSISENIIWKKECVMNVEVWVKNYITKVMKI